MCLGTADKAQCSVSVSLSDTMENWDEKKLEEVVNKKHGEAEKKKPKTQIVRPFSLEGLVWGERVAAFAAVL